MRTLSLIRARRESPKPSFPLRIVTLLLHLIFGSVFQVFAQVEIEPNATVSQATTVTSGQQVQGSLYDRNDVDYYKLPLTSQQEVTVTLSTTAREQFYEMGLLVEVLNASNAKVGGFSSETATPIDTKLIAGPGDLFISVRKDPSNSRFEGTLQYFLTVTSTAMGTAVTVEIEPNAAISQATTVTSGQQVQGSLYDRNDVDYYKLPLTSQQEVTVTLSTTTREQFYEMGLLVEIFNSSNAKVGGFSSETANPIDTKLIAGPGDLFISVRKDPSNGRFEGTLQYFLTVTSTTMGTVVTVEMEPNATISQATTVASGQQVQGSLYDRNDVDYYKLVLASQQDVTVALSTTTREQFYEMGLLVEIFNSSNAKIGGFSSETANPIDSKLIAGPGDLFISVRKDPSNSRFEGTLQYFLTVTGIGDESPNNVPVLAEISNKAVVESQTLSFSLSATDPDGDVLTYSVTGNPAGSSLSGNTFTWTPTSGQAGSYTPSFTVSDGRGGTDSENVTITVTTPAPVNQAPVLAEIGNKAIEEGQTLSFAVSATDADGDVLTYLLEGNPAGSSLSGNSFTWTPSSGQAGSYAPIFAVSDGKGATDSESVTITVTAPALVNEAPVLAEIGGKAIDTGRTLSFVLSATDVDGDALTYSVTGNPSGSSLTSNTFTWTPASGQAGSYTPNFTVSDGRGGTDSESVIITVTTSTQVNQPPTLEEIWARTIEERQTLSFALSAADADGDGLAYSVTDSPAGSSLSGNTFTWTPASGQAGSYAPIFTVSDGKGGTDSKTVIIDVTASANVNQPPVLEEIGDKSTEEGQLLSFTLSATDPDSDPLTYSVTDNPAGSSLVSGVFSWTPAANQVGIYAITFTVSDGHEGVDNQTTQITVSARNHSPTLPDVVDQEVEEGQKVSFSLDAADPDDDPLTYTVAGDPSGSQLTDSQFSWIPDIGQAGSYTMVFTVDDGRGGTDSQPVTIKVIQGNRPPVLADIANQEVQEGRALAFTLKATDADEDPLTYSVTGNPTGSTLEGRAFSWTPEIGQANSYTLTFSVSDGNGGSHSQSLTIIVTRGNRAPELIDLVDREVQEGQTISFALTATDADGDPLTYSVTDNPAGSTLSGSVFAWKPAIGQTGSFSVEFSVQDPNGGSDVQTISIRVTERPKPRPTQIRIAIRPTVPIEESDIQLQIDATFSSTSATIAQHSYDVQDSILTIALLTDRMDDPSAGEPQLSCVEEIGQLAEGNYTIIVTVNGDEYQKETLQVRDQSGSAGLISMDFDLDDGGNQGTTSKGGGEPGKEYQIELHLKNARIGISGWSITAIFDPDEIEYVAGSFEPSGLINGLVPLVDVGIGRVEIGGAVLGVSEEPPRGGLLGTVSFRLLDGFEEETSIIVAENNLRFSEGGSEKYPTYFVASITGRSLISGDFDGDGKVDFTDFFAFADAFGGSDPMFDLDDSGKVDFSDFFLFADSFGTQERAKLIRLAEKHIGLPRPTQIEQSYPNPFNSSAAVRYSVQQPSLARLFVVDMAGQIVRTLTDQHHVPGSYQITWDGRDDGGKQVSSGVYIVKLAAETATDTHKITFVK